MIVDKYTKHTIFSLPLLFNGISAKELKDNQFINMYVYDKNRPLLDCIYLVFKNINSSFLNKLSKLNSYYNTIYKSINGTIYTIVAFKQDEFDNYIINSINKAMYYTIGYENKIKIIKFWFNPKMNENIFRYLFDENFIADPPIDECIDLYDTNKAVDLMSTAFFISITLEYCNHIIVIFSFFLKIFTFIYCSKRSNLN